ncbi:MAG: TOMM precursor leader peptide-binding protein [Micromonosporaceae bacterium]
MSLLDGTKDLPTVLRAMPGGMDAEQVADLIAQLRAAGLVELRTSDEDEADRTASAYWDACQVDPERHGRGSPRVQLIPVAAAAERQAVQLALSAAGIAVTSASGYGPGEAELSVVVCDDYLNPVLGDVDTAHRAAGTPWLLAKPVGTHVWLGPVFQPGSTGCWHCLATRLWRHRHAEECAQACLGHSGPAPRPAVSLPALSATAANLLALEATKWLAGHRHPGQQCVWVFDSVNLLGQRHELRARPQCSQCGDPTLVARRAESPVELRPTRKAWGQSGGHRSLPPETVYETYQHLVSPVTGVVKEITPDRRGPQWMHSYRSGPCVAKGVPDVDQLGASLRGHCGGKGTTALEAEVGALCEALERYSGIRHGDEKRIRGSLRSLGEQAIHPNDCMLFSDDQYRTRADWNAAHGRFQQVCGPFDVHAETDWTPLWSLTERRHRLLPTAMLYFSGYATPGSAGVIADSNGNAAGSSLEDAVLQGLLELVERDAVALWWHNRSRVPGVELGGFGDPWIAEQPARYAELGRELWALDVTSDLGIPVMVAVSRYAGDGGAEELWFGLGAHLDPRIALRRALTELNQLMPGVLDPATVAFDDPDAERWRRHATLASEPYLSPDPGHIPRNARNYQYSAYDDIYEEVALVSGRLAARGMDTLVLDQTRPDIGLPVVKVIVPGLRHFWARYAPGRLFDVPVALGRRPEPTRPDELNPMLLFL